MRLAPNSEPLPPSIEIPCFDTFSGDKEHDSYISTHKIDIHYSTYTRPVRPDQKDLFFDSENGEACYPLKIVPEVDEVSRKDNQYDIDIIEFNVTSSVLQGSSLSRVFLIL